MKPSERQKFADLLVGVFSVYRVDISRVQMEVWWKALAGLDLEAVNQALLAHVQNPDTGQYPPKPADVVRMVGGTTKDQAVLAWSKVAEAVRSIGPYRTVVFDDPVIHRSIEDLGGWPALCRTNEKEWPFAERRFCDLYRAYRFRGEVPVHPSKLVGLAESTNNFNGWGEDPRAKEAARPVLLGDAHACKLIADGSMAPKPLALPERVKA